MSLSFIENRYEFPLSESIGYYTYDELLINYREQVKFLLEKRKKGRCSKIMIYTNNQGPKSWAQQISAYFDYKLGVKIFDKIIAAFKVKGKIVENYKAQII